MFVSSVYSTQICYEHLVFLLQKCIAFDSADNCYIPYDILDSKWSDWKKDFKNLFEVSFPAYNKNVLMRCHWLDSICFDDVNRVFYFELSKVVWNNIQSILCKYPSEYDSIIRMKRMYTFQIFEFLKGKYGDSCFCESFSKDFIKKICNIEEDCYTNDAEFKRTVLCMAVKDINLLLGWNLSLRTKRGKNGCFEFTRR